MKLAKQWPWIALAVFVVPCISVLAINHFTETQYIEKYSQLDLRVLDYSEFQLDAENKGNVDISVILQDVDGKTYSFTYPKMRDGITTLPCQTDFKRYMLQHVRPTQHVLLTKSLIVTNVKRFTLDDNLGELMCGEFVDKQAPMPEHAIAKK